MEPTARRAQRLDGATLFAEISGVPALAAGWERCWRNQGAAGGDGQTLASFARGLGQRLSDLSADLRSGRYRPLPLREAQIPKPGKPDKRLLRIPAVRDRVVQTAASQVLMPHLDAEMEDGSHGYRPGRGVQTAVAAVQYWRRQGFVWTVDADIDDFFDRIPIDPLMDRFHASVSESPLSDLVGVWLEHGARDGRGLAQGSPLSPLLANLYLDTLDETFTRRNLKIVRYADDFVILAKDRPAAERALDDLSQFLAGFGLALNREKTRLRDYDSTLTFLGQAFVRSWVMRADEDPDADDSAAEELLQRLARLDEEEEALRAHQDADLERLTKAGYDPGLRVLSVLTPGRRIGLRNLSFSVLEAPEQAGSFLPADGAAPGTEILAIHPTRIDRIELGPLVEMDLNAQRHALASAIPVAFTNGHGETLGHLAPVLAPRAGRHMAQARALLDPDKRLDMAKTLVGARLANQRALLRRINSRRGLPAVATTANGLTRLKRRLRIAKTVEEAMGHEGLGAALYWRAFDRLLLNGFKLDGRTRRKKADPVNAALDMASSLLQRDISAIVLARGLHPGFGALHATSDGRDACVYDLMEVFRAGMVESLVLRLVNMGMIRRDMFSALEDGTSRMGGSAQRALIRAYESQAVSTVSYPRTGQKMSWRRVMMLEAEAYAAHLDGRTAWHPFVLNY
jgi:CRISPR-associated protein Cas1